MSSFLTIWSRIPFSLSFISQYGWVVKASGSLNSIRLTILWLFECVVQSGFSGSAPSKRKASGGLYLWQLLSSPIVPEETGWRSNLLNSLELYRLMIWPIQMRSIEHLRNNSYIYDCQNGRWVESSLNEFSIMTFQSGLINYDTQFTTGNTRQYCRIPEITHIRLLTYVKRYIWDRDHMKDKTYDWPDI